MHNQSHQKPNPKIYVIKNPKQKYAQSKTLIISSKILINNMHNQHQKSNTIKNPIKIHAQSKTLKTLIKNIFDQKS